MTTESTPAKVRLSDRFGPNAPVAQIMAEYDGGEHGRCIEPVNGWRALPIGTLLYAPRWVPVDEALPPEHVTCAVRMDGDYIAVAWSSYWHGGRTDFARWVFPHDSDEGFADKITHWLALPPLPALGPNV